MKKQVQGAHLISAGDASGNLTSSVMRISMIDNISIQSNVVGTVAGTLTYQVSCDHKEDELGNVVVAGNWTSLGTHAVSNAAILRDAFSNVPEAYLRVVFTYSSNTGPTTIDVYVSGKSFS